MQYGKWKNLTNKNSIKRNLDCKWKILFFEDTSNGSLLLNLLLFLCGKDTPAPEQENNWAHKT
jgi:hypothetical protein